MWVYAARYHARYCYLGRARSPPPPPFSTPSEHNSLECPVLGSLQTLQLGVVAGLVLLLSFLLRPFLGDRYYEQRAHTSKRRKGGREGEAVRVGRKHSRHHLKWWVRWWRYLYSTTTSRCQRAERDASSVGGGGVVAAAPALHR